MNKRYMVPGPFHGIVSDLPSASDRQAFDDCLNLLCRKGRLISRPNLNNNISLSPDGTPILGLRSFQDANGHYHTCAMTATQVYDLVTHILPPHFTWSIETNTVGSLGTRTNLPYSILNVNNRLYVANASGFLFYIEGSGTLNISGDTPGSPLFLTSNASHLIGAAWYEITASGNNKNFYGNKVRWSDVGNFDSWAISASSTAGVAYIQETPDTITGLTNLNTYTYITRSNGFSVMYPTGVSTKPFMIEPLSVSLEGAGNYYPYSLDSNGNYFCCIAQHEILMFDGTNWNPLGFKKAKSSIFKDINLATGPISGKCITTFNETFDFESYWLTIPGPNVTWIYGVEEGNWTRINSSLGALTSLAHVYLR